MNISRNKMETGPESQQPANQINIPSCPYFELAKDKDSINDYPPRFSSGVLRNWHQICKFMGWLKDNKPIDFNNFEHASDRKAVIKMIQEKIINAGHQLSKYGPDGNFGPETEQTLLEVMSSSIPIQPLQPEQAVEKKETNSFQLNLFEKFTAIVEKAESMIQSAHLSLDQFNMKDALDPQFVKEYQEKATAFRMKLMENHPEISQQLQNISSLITGEVQKINISDFPTEDIGKIVAIITEMPPPNALSGFIKLPANTDPSISWTIMLTILYEWGIVALHSLARRDERIRNYITTIP